MSVTHEMICSAHWFGGLHSTVGAVLIFADPAGHKVYLGAVSNIGVRNEMDDALYIANWGARVKDRAVCAALFPDVTEWAKS